MQFKMSVIFYLILCVSLSPPIKCSFNLDLAEGNYPDGQKPFTDLANLKSSDYSDYRLPTNLKPSSYDLTFTPFLSNATFRGHANITFDVVNATSEIVLNIRVESIREASLMPFVMQSSPAVTVTNTTIDEEHQMVRFHLNDTLQEQKDAVISIYYDGVFGSEMHGFYLSSYNTTTSTGEQTNHLMAITQFESTYARRAFPCFDEPAYRANFTIAIYRGSNQTSMSNMKLAFSNGTSDELVLDKYKTSPAMPTYLVAFGMSEFASKSDGGNVRVLTRPDVIQDAAYALSVGQPLLDSIGNITNITYPLEKMDIVAVPDFSAGAMENWGLTTFREKYVLYNSKKNTKRDLYLLVSVIGHEFAHQWFGDLVTPEWWDYAWLNEAFATYFEYLVPNQLYPDWNIGSTMYITSALQEALDSDIGNTRPMTYPVYSPSQIESVFDYVIYEKGGSVLRMIDNFLTNAVWKDGLYRYLTDAAYKTGTPDKLFSALEAAAYAANSSIAPRVVATLNAWTTQPGYPLVTLHKKSASVYLITQVPYELNSTKSYKWSIPLTYTSQEEAQFDPTKAASMLLYNTAETVVINTTGWVILNVDQIGYFRVNYDDENWSKIINQLNSNHTVIEKINRAQLLDDAFHLARTGHLNYSTVMALTEYLPKENGYAPWYSFITNMRFLVNQFYNTPTGKGLMQYARKIMGSPFQALTSNLTSSTSSFLGSLTLLDASQFSCEMHLPDCEKLATFAFQKWTNDPYSIPPETRQAVICTQLRLDSSGKSFQTVLDYFLNSDNGGEQLTLLRAMGCVTNEAAINMYLNVVCDVSANHVRLQDRFIAFGNLVSHQSGVAPGLQYLVNNYDKVAQALGKKINSIFTNLGDTISQEAHIAQVRSLVNDTKVDQRLREKLETFVLPPVVKRQAWTQSTQAAQLKNWVNNISSSASSIFVHSVFIVLFCFFLTSHLQFNSL